MPSLVVLLIWLSAVVFTTYLCLKGGQNKLLAASPIDSSTSSIAVYFSPHGNCAAAIDDVIQRATKSIYVMAYYLTNPVIVSALTERSKAGVTVKVITDPTGDHAPCLQDLLAAGAELAVDSQHAIFHDKVMIIDGTTVITGSYNFTHAAETNNAENLLIIRAQPVARAYMDNWNEHRQHSQLVKRISR